MRVGKSSMDPVRRIWTRGYEDNYWRNAHNELKRKQRQESGADSGVNDRNDSLSSGVGGQGGMRDDAEYLAFLSQFPDSSYSNEVGENVDGDEGESSQCKGVKRERKGIRESGRSRNGKRKKAKKGREEKENDKGGVSDESLENIDGCEGVEQRRRGVKETDHSRNLLRKAKKGIEVEKSEKGSFSYERWEKIDEGVERCIEGVEESDHSMSFLRKTRSRMEVEKSDKGSASSEGWKKLDEDVEMWAKGVEESDWSRSLQKKANKGIEVEKSNKDTLSEEGLENVDGDKISQSKGVKRKRKGVEETDFGRTLEKRTGEESSNKADHGSIDNDDDDVEVVDSNGSSSKLGSKSGSAPSSGLDKVSVSYKSYGSVVEVEAAPSSSEKVEDPAAVADVEKEKDQVTGNGETDVEYGNIDEKSTDSEEKEDVVVISDDEESVSVGIGKGEHGQSSGVDVSVEPGSVSSQETSGFMEGAVKKRKVCGLNILEPGHNLNESEGNSIRYRLRSRASQPEKMKHDTAEFSCPQVLESKESVTSLDEDSERSEDEDSETSLNFEVYKSEPIRKLNQKGTETVPKVRRKGTAAKLNHDLRKIILDSMQNGTSKEEEKEKEKDKEKVAPDTVDVSATLPLKFGFEDLLPPPRAEKSEQEKEIDSLFRFLELGLVQSETDNSSASISNDDSPVPEDIDKSLPACCRRGYHNPFLDEEIGIKCLYCPRVLLEINSILPPFYTPTRRRRWEYDHSSERRNSCLETQFQNSACSLDHHQNHEKETVWDLIPGVAKEMYRHQREGVEFLWKNMAGGIHLKDLGDELPDGGEGCIISHAPGTGKTRLTLVFLQTFMAQFKHSRPVIIAPRGMLLTWESEFLKWKVDIPFHSLNKAELSGQEDPYLANLLEKLGAQRMSKETIRLVKLYSWKNGRSILGISYQMFEKLAGDHGEKGEHEKIRKILLESPGLLVLDEGHTPRNEQSGMWNALKQVATQRRIILSGTPFQNNFSELYNTFCLVNQKIVDKIVSQLSRSQCKKHGRKSSSAARGKWFSLTNSISNKELKKIRIMINPFLHVHKGSILKRNLPGLRETLVLLQPTGVQKLLLETAAKMPNHFKKDYLVSSISVHPSLAEDPSFSMHKDKLEATKSDPEAGAKTMFLFKLIRLADALGERVLVFSQFLYPIGLIKKLLKSSFSWNEGREVFYMDGQLDEKQRQDCIASFNDDQSEAKVLLASEKACSEGISLVGASRVVLLDSVWNPSVERQAISRAYRLGQKKVVHVYRLMTSGTMEVRKYTLQAKKDRVAELVFSPGAGHEHQSETSNVVSDDKLLEAMLDDKRFSDIIAKIIYQPKGADVAETSEFC